MAVSSTSYRFAFAVRLISAHDLPDRMLCFPTIHTASSPTRFPRSQTEALLAVHGAQGPLSFAGPAFCTCI